MIRDITKFIIECHYSIDTVLFLISQKLNCNLGNSIIIKKGRIILDIVCDFESSIIGFKSLDYK